MVDRVVELESNNVTSSNGDGRSGIGWADVACYIV